MEGNSCAFFNPQSLLLSSANRFHLFCRNPILCSSNNRWSCCPTTAKGQCKKQKKSQNTPMALFQCLNPAVPEANGTSGFPSFLSQHPLSLKLVSQLKFELSFRYWKKKRYLVNTGRFYSVFLNVLWVQDLLGLLQTKNSSEKRGIIPAHKNPLSLCPEQTWNMEVSRHRVCSHHSTSINEVLIENQTIFYHLIL